MHDPMCPHGHSCAALWQTRREHRACATVNKLKCSPVSMTGVLALASQQNDNAGIQHTDRQHPRRCTRPVCKPVVASQDGALAWVHHRHSSKACSVPSSRTSTPGCTSLMPTPSLISTPSSCAQDTSSSNGNNKGGNDCHGAWWSLEVLV